MTTINVKAGSFTLDKGFYRIETKTSDVEFIDLNDKRRGCLLRKGCKYYLQLSSDISDSEFKLSESNIDDSFVDISPISELFFKTLVFFAGARRNVMQRFGPNDRLLAFCSDKSNLSNAAAKNVEYRYLRLYGLEDSSVSKNQWTWVDQAWPVKGFNRNEYIVDPNMLDKGCVYVHIHYWETWPEIEAVLLNDCRGLDLILTSTTKQDAEFKSISQKFPNCRISVVDNRGRDIGPFMELLRTGAFDGYDAVCKIHGKLSKKNGKETLIGTRIRRYLLACLLADGACIRNFEKFMSDPALGIAGPGNLLLPPPNESIKHYIASELSFINSVIDRSGRQGLSDEIEFFAGSMFWFRPTALETLRFAHIGLYDFDSENGAKRNTLQHALERLFCLFAKDAGFTIKTLQPMKVTAIQQ